MDLDGLDEIDQIIEKMDKGVLPKESGKRKRGRTTKYLSNPKKSLFEKRKGLKFNHPVDSCKISINIKESEEKNDTVVSDHLKGRKFFVRKGNSSPLIKGNMSPIDFVSREKVDEKIEVKGEDKCEEVYEF